MAAALPAKPAAGGGGGAGGAWRVSSTRAESTWGTGQNTVRSMVKVRRAEAYQATLALGTP